jgi:hypothetical protein
LPQKVCDFVDTSSGHAHKRTKTCKSFVSTYNQPNLESTQNQEELLKCSKLTGLDEMSQRANYMLAWRLFSPQGDLANLREGRLRQHQHDHSTRSVINGVVTQQATYDSFIEKLAVTFNQIREETKSCPSKNAAKVVIRISQKKKVAD